MGRMRHAGSRGGTDRRVTQKKKRKEKKEEADGQARGGGESVRDRD
jgi:hypothetical protein